MHIMLDLTDDGDIVDENGERHPLFQFDPGRWGTTPSSDPRRDAKYAAD